MGYQTIGDADFQAQEEARIIKESQDNAPSEDSADIPPEGAPDPLELRKRAAYGRAVNDADAQAAREALGSTGSNEATYPVTFVEGYTKPGSEPGWDFSKFDGPPKWKYLGQPTHAPGWMDNYMRSEGEETPLDKQLAFHGGKEDVYRTFDADWKNKMAKIDEWHTQQKEKAGLLEAQANARLADAEFSKHAMREQEWRRKTIDDEIAKRDTLRARLREEYNTPDRVFDARTGGAHGVLGVIAALAWGLATPEYQKNSVAVMNSLAEQDYRNKMRRRQTLRGQLESSNDLLAAYERAYGRSVHAAEMYKGHLRNYMADQIQAMGDRSTSEQVRRAAPIVAQQMRIASDMKEREAIARFRTPGTPGKHVPYFDVNKSGQVVGVNLPGGGRGQVRNESDDIAVFQYDGKTFGAVVGKGKEEFQSRLADYRRAADDLTNAADAFRDAESTEDPAQAAELLDMAVKGATVGLGQATQAAKSGVLNGGEKVAYQKSFTAMGDELNTLVGGSKAEIEQKLRNMTGRDRRTLLQRVGGNLRQIAEMSRRAQLHEVGGRSIYAHVAERDPRTKAVIAEGWVPTGTGITTPAGTGAKTQDKVLNPAEKAEMQRKQEAARRKRRNEAAVRALKGGGAK